MNTMDKITLDRSHAAMLSAVWALLRSLCYLML